MKQTRLFLLLVICLVLLNSCSSIQTLQVSQDKLPWKASGEILLEDDFRDDTTGWEVVNNVYELKGYSSEGYLISINHKGGRSISTTGLQFSDIKIQVETQDYIAGTFRAMCSFELEIPATQLGAQAGSGSLGTVVDLPYLM